MTKSNKTILIIESDYSLRWVLSMAMDLEGHTVLEADSEKSAQIILESTKEPIHCILNRVSDRPENHNFNFGDIPIISPREGLLDLQDLSHAIDQIN